MSSAVISLTDAPKMHVRLPLLSLRCGMGAPSPAWLPAALDVMAGAAADAVHSLERAVVRLAEAAGLAERDRLAEEKYREWNRQKQLEAQVRANEEQERALRDRIEALQKREEKMWEKSRQKRVQGWRSWSNGAGVVKNKIPRVKEERRADGTSGYNQGNDDRGMGYRKDWR